MSRYIPENVLKPDLELDDYLELSVPSDDDELVTFINSVVPLKPQSNNPQDESKAPSTSKEEATSCLPDSTSNAFDNFNTAYPSSSFNMITSPPINLPEIITSEDVQQPISNLPDDYTGINALAKHLMSSNTEQPDNTVQLLAEICNELEFCDPVQTTSQNIPTSYDLQAVESPKAAAAHRRPRRIVTTSATADNDLPKRAASHSTEKRGRAPKAKRSRNKSLPYDLMKENNTKMKASARAAKQPKVEKAKNNAKIIIRKSSRLSHKNSKTQKANDSGVVAHNFDCNDADSLIDINEIMQLDIVEVKLDDDSTDLEEMDEKKSNSNEEH